MAAGRRGAGSGRLEGKTAIITGGSSGIGKAIAVRFSQEGARVVLGDIDAENGQRVAEELTQGGGSATFRRTDVRNEKDCSSLVEEALGRFGGLDILINCAGIPTRRNAVTATQEEWDRCMEVNLRGAWFCSKAAIRLMSAQGGGSIVNIASTHAFRTQPNHFPYQSTKAGMIAMGLSMSVDFGEHGIRVNNICPGLIATARADEEWEQYPDPEQARRRVLEIHPLGRIGRPEDVANAALFLASEEADFITGTNLVVDGGRSAVTQNLSGLMK